MDEHLNCQLTKKATDTFYIISVLCCTKHFPTQDTSQYMPQGCDPFKSETAMLCASMHTLTYNIVSGISMSFIEECINITSFLSSTYFYFNCHYLFLIFYM